jgi:hypothetical protein
MMPMLGTCNSPIASRRAQSRAFPMNSLQTILTIIYDIDIETRGSTWSAEKVTTRDIQRHYGVANEDERAPLMSSGAQQPADVESRVRMLTFKLL